VVDVDRRVEAPQKMLHLQVDKEKAMPSGIAPQQITQAMNMALGNRDMARLYTEHTTQEVGIKLALAESDKKNIQQVLQLELLSPRGSSVTIGDFVTVQEKTIPHSIYCKNQRRVVYVTAEIAGEL